MQLKFRGTIWYWKGPAPWFFVSVPDEHYFTLKCLAATVTYGGGMIPARVRIGNTEWETSLFHKDGAYVIPIKAVVRRTENLDEGNEVVIWLEIQ